MVFVLVEVTREIPFVSSIIPEIIGILKIESILSTSKIGYRLYEMSCNILLVFNMEIITENITTKPPIIIIVLLDSRIASERIEPKSFKLHDWTSLLIYMFEKLFSELDFILEYKPRIKPTEIADSICVKNSKIPIEELENIVIPHSSDNKEWTRVICKC